MISTKGWKFPTRRVYFIIKKCYFKKIFKDRWDSPLFEVRDTEPTPLKEIAQVILFEEKKAKDPISTKSVLSFLGAIYFKIVVFLIKNRK